MIGPRPPKQHSMAEWRFTPRSPNSKSNILITLPHWFSLIFSQNILTPLHTKLKVLQNSHFECGNKKQKKPRIQKGQGVTQETTLHKCYYNSTEILAITHLSPSLSPSLLFS